MQEQEVWKYHFFDKTRMYSAPFWSASEEEGHIL